MENPAVVFTGPKQVAVQARPMPAPGANEALIRSEVTLISTGTELTVLGYGEQVGNVWTSLRTYPSFPGYCNTGVIEAVGPDLDPALVGSRVQSYGAHAAYVVQPMSLLRPVPAGVDPSHAAFATMVEIAFNGVRRSGVSLGTAVVVYGLGILGQIAVRCARLCGARPVVAVDVAPRRLDLLPSDPAVHGLAGSYEEVRRAVKDLTRDRMADVVIELTGNAKVIPDEISLLRDQGTLAIVSGTRGTSSLDLHDSCLAPSIRILGIHNASHTPVPTAADPWTKNRDVELFFDLLLDGDIDLSGLISHHRPFSDAPSLYRLLGADRTQAMGVLLDWRGNSPAAS